MDYSLPIKAFIGTYFTINNLSGAEKLLITAVSATQGIHDAVVSTSTIGKTWQKSLLKLKYHHSYYSDAQVKGWVKPVATGKMMVTASGFEHIQNIANIGSSLQDDSTELMLFSAKQSHSFDKMLREVFAQAVDYVRIADSYVDATIFDNVLDNIPTTVDVKLMYGNSPDDIFNARVVRFKQQYKSFTLARHNHLHDRFIIVDGVGFIIGPSIKNAAHKSAAIVVKLNLKESQRLLNFFDNQFKGLNKT